MNKGRVNGIQNMSNHSDKILFSEDFIDGGIAFSDWSNEATDGDDARLSQVDSSVFVEVADVELDWSVVFWCDESVGVVAFPWEVKIG